MKIEILQEELVKALAIVIRAVSSRVQLPILSAVKMEALKTELVLSATDLEIGIRHTAAAKVLEQGAVAVPAKTLNELLLTLAPGKLEMELKEGNLIIKSGNFVGKIATQDAHEFPAIGTAGEALTKVSAGEFARAVGNVSFASAKEALRPVLTGILLEVGEKLRLIATDGFRLAVSTAGIKGSYTTAKESLLLPARAMAEGSRILKDGEIKIGYLAEAKQVILEGEQTIFTTQLIEGSFPDYNKILPKEFEVRMTVSREELVAAVKTALVFARDNSNMMRWRVGEGKLIITSSANGSGEGVLEVAAKIEGEGTLEVVFNAKYVLDYLALLGGESLWIGLGGKLAPGMMAESENGRESSFYVVMPINA